MSARVPLGEPGVGGRPSARSLYIHIPFCSHKCHYCDFYSFVDTRDQQGVFVDRLLRELEALAPHAASQPLATIFVGGGTPSLLGVGLWRRMLRHMHERFDLSLMGDGGGEFTVECNPESVTEELAGVLRAGGVNRVSMGAQSFEHVHLATLERRHKPEMVGRALEIARRAGIARQSIDLIYAIPGQTLDQWRCDLGAALALGTTHLSCYNLTYEPNTAMTARLKRGEFVPVVDDLEADMFELTGEMLTGAGLERYEVSNYASGGIDGPNACRHNLAYWRQEQWLAAGPSASAHVWASADRRAGGHRWKNAPNLGTYLAQDDGGYAPIVDHEPTDATRALRERIMTGVRLSEGVAPAALLADAAWVAGPKAEAGLRARAAELVGDGLLEADGRWRVTPRGWLVADFVAKRLMGALEGPPRGH